jgi:hypothetical protein
MKTARASGSRVTDTCGVLAVEGNDAYATQAQHELRGEQPRQLGVVERQMHLLVGFGNERPGVKVGAEHAPRSAAAGAYGHVTTLQGRAHGDSKRCVGYTHRGMQGQAVGGLGPGFLRQDEQRAVGVRDAGP